jgi:hypothetical protein
VTLAALAALRGVCIRDPNQVTYQGHESLRIESSFAIR